MMANDEGTRIILRAEVDAEVERLRAENAAWREIGQVVATRNTLEHAGDVGDDISCTLCDGEEYKYDRDEHRFVYAERDPFTGEQFFHASDCPVLKARALLGMAAQGQES